MPLLLTLPDKQSKLWLSDGARLLAGQTDDGSYQIQVGVFFIKV